MYFINKTTQNQGKTADVSDTVHTLTIGRWRTSVLQWSIQSNKIDHGPDIQMKEAVLKLEIEVIAIQNMAVNLSLVQ